MPVKVPENETIDRATLGDAILAGYGIGMIDDVMETSKSVCRFGKIVEPDKEWSKVYDELYHLYRKMYIHLEDDLKELSTIGGNK